MKKIYNSSKKSYSIVIKYDTKLESVKDFIEEELNGIKKKDNYIITIE